MTRKDYVMLAAAIKAARDEIRAKEPGEWHREMIDGTSYAADFIADTLARDNPRFDRARFLVACGIGE